tara:strand:+ start:3667 stop:4083 length:417 start_codon:yes stop_codon:yes gene_type:complete
MVKSSKSSKSGKRSKEFNKLCAPAKFYLVMSFIGFLLYVINLPRDISMLSNVESMVIHIIFMLAWTGLLNWICGLKYGTTISWFIVFLPLILFLILFIIVYHMMETNKLSNKDLQRLVKENKENKEDDIEGLANSCKD